MRLCKVCGAVMEEVKSFSPENNTKYFRCPRCRSETKPVKLQESELKYEEHDDKKLELHKILNKKSDAPRNFGERPAHHSNNNRNKPVLHNQYNKSGNKNQVLYRRGSK